MTTLKFNQPTLKTLDSFLDNLLNDLPAANNTALIFLL